MIETKQIEMYGSLPYFRGSYARQLWSRLGQMLVEPFYVTEGGNEVQVRGELVPKSAAVDWLAPADQWVEKYQRQGYLVVAPIVLSDEGFLSGRPQCGVAENATLVAVPPSSVESLKAEFAAVQPYCYAVLPEKSWLRSDVGTSLLVAVVALGGSALLVTLGSR